MKTDGLPGGAECPGQVCLPPRTQASSCSSPPVPLCHLCSSLGPQPSQHYIPAGGPPCLSPRPFPIALGLFSLRAAVCIFS